MNLQSLKDQNQRQSYVIRILGEAIYNETKRKNLLDQVKKHEIPSNSTAQIQIQLENLLNSIKKQQNDAQSNREEELRRLIREQETQQQKLTEQIETYQQKAAEFDAEMAKIEAEKQELYKNIGPQNSVPPSPRSANQELISLFGSSMKHENDEELEEKIKQADEEIESLTNELNELTKTLEAKQEEYRQIQEKFLNQSL